MCSKAGDSKLHKSVMGAFAFLVKDEIGQGVKFHLGETNDVAWITLKKVFFSLEKRTYTLRLVLYTFLQPILLMPNDWNTAHLISYCQILRNTVGMGK